MARTKTDKYQRVTMPADIEALRAEKFAPGKHHPCYDGQWTVHPEHSYEVRVQMWLGGGYEQVTCHGVKEGERMQDRYPQHN